MSLTDCLLTDFARLRDRLDAVLASEAEIFESLGETSCAADLAAARRNLAEDRFRIVVMGEMKRGKSTLINALLGEELLPVLPGIVCTAIPICVQHGEPKRAVCYRQSSQAPLECELPGEVQKFIQAVTVPPKDRRVGSDDDAFAIRTHPYERAEVFAPLVLLENGAELQDTAGLNEDSRRSDTTWNQAEGADAIILVLDSTKVGSQSDREDLQRIWDARRDPRVVFVVWNMIDRYHNNVSAYEQVQAQAIAMIEPMGVARDHIVFLSAEEALRGRKEGVPDLIESSGITPFEQTLNTFLVTERSGAKLFTPLNIAEHAINDALFTLRLQRADSWLGPAEQVRGIAKQANNLLHESKLKRTNLTARLQAAANSFRNGVSLAAKSFVGDHQEGIDRIIEQESITAREAIFSPNASIKQLIGAVESWLSAQAEIWEHERIFPLVAEYKSEVELHATEILSELESYADRVAGFEQEAMAYEDAETESKVGGHVAEYSIDTDQLVRKITSIIGGALPEESPLAGIGMGALVGGVAAIWLSVVFALPLVLAVIAFVLLGSLIGGRGASGILKSRTSEAIKKAMAERSSGLERSLLAKITEGCEQVNTAASESLDKVIDIIQKSVEAIESRYTEEQRLAAERKDLADRLRTRLQKHRIELTDIRNEIDDLYRPHLLSGQVASEVESKIPSTEQVLPVTERGDIHDGTTSLSSMKTKLGKGGWARLQEVKRYLKDLPSWKPRMESDIAQVWSEWLEFPKSDASQQKPVFWAVIALTIYRGQAVPPHPKDVKGLYRNLETQIELARLYILISGDEHGAYFADTQGKRGTAEERFLRTYTRAYGKFTKAPNDGSIRSETINHSINDRDPYKPTE